MDFSFLSIMKGIYFTIQYKLLTNYNIKSIYITVEQWEEEIITNFKWRIWSNDFRIQTFRELFVGQVVCLETGKKISYLAIVVLVIYKVTWVMVRSWRTIHDLYLVLIWLCIYKSDCIIIVIVFFFTLAIQTIIQN